MNSILLATDEDFKVTIHSLLPKLGLSIKKEKTDLKYEPYYRKRKQFADQCLEYPQNLVLRFAHAVTIDEGITNTTPGEDIYAAMKAVYNTLAGVEEGEEPHA